MLQNRFLSRSLLHSLLLSLILCTQTFLSGAEEAQAQETSQVIITGIPGLLDTPFINELENDYDSGQYQVQFIYNAPGRTSEREFEFVFQVFKDGSNIAEERSDPVSFAPGTYFLDPFFNDIEFNVLLEDVIGDLDGDLQNQLLQTGALPEGNYSIRIEAEPTELQPVVASVPGISNFVVRYPQPPILISPQDESILSQQLPVFTWTPVTAPGAIMVEYNFLLVEVFEGQNPGDALLSNRPQHQRTLSSTSLVYSPDLLPLEVGKEYAWQVIASDANGRLPFASDGESDIYTFKYGEGDEEVPEELEFITLVPGLARLNIESSVEMVRRRGAIILNGPATVELTFSDGSEGSVTATIDDLRIVDGRLDQPVITSGSVTLDEAQTQGIAGQMLPEFVTFDRVRYQKGSGLQAALKVELPMAEGTSVSSAISITPGGLSGVATVSGDPLAAYESEWLNMMLSNMEISFPSGNISASGDIRVLQEDTGCELTQLVSDGQVLNASFSCQEDFNIPLIQGSELLSFEVDRISGTVGIGLENGELDYDLNLKSMLGLRTTEDNYCGTGVDIGISSGEPINLKAVPSACPEIDPMVDLGFAKVGINNLKLNELSLDPASGEWDFELMMDSRLEIPAFDDWVSPKIDGIVINKEGASFETIDFAAQSAPLPSYDAQQLHVALNELRLNEFIFPLFDWDQSGPGPWDVDFGGEATIVSATGMPYCLIGTTLELDNGEVYSDRVSADLSLGNFEGCTWEVSPHLSLELTDISGTVGADYTIGENIEPFGIIAVGGGVLLNSPFECADEPSETFTTGALSFSDGIEGELTNFVPDCPVDIGPYPAQVTNSKLTFSTDNDGVQEIVMEAEATLNLPQGVTASGSFALDLIEGRFLDVSFDIEGPFVWNIPNEEQPVLRFRLDSATINRDGLLINGRQDFLLAGESRRVTFDNLLIGLEHRKIKSGRILFDESFAFEVGITGENNELSFSAIPSDNELSVDPGLKFNLSSSVAIDTAGVKASGSANASIAFNDRRYDELLSVNYSDDFSVGFEPFGVNSGEATFMFDGSPVATLDESGFHPNFGFFADYLVPERLPMPSEEIAYIQLRDEDELLVEVNTDSDGNLMISSLPQQPLSMVVPYLNPANPPEVAQISFNNFVITSNPLNPEVVSGSVSADVPEDSPLFDLENKNIPLNLRRIEYGVLPDEDSNRKALYLLGSLNLFEQDLGGDNDVAFFIRGNGLVEADLALSGMNAEFSLLPQDQVVMGVDGITGTFSVPVNGGTPSYDFNLTGDLEILTDEGYQAGAGMTLRSSNGGFFSITDFQSYAFSNTPGIDIGDFGLELDELIDMPVFNYSPENGFEFAIALDLGITIPLADDKTLAFPLTGVEIRHDGITIPQQDINESQVPGLSLPELELAGFSLQPLALRTTSSLTYSWDSGFDSSPGFLFDFSLQLPEFQGTGLNPPDGFLFSDVGFDDGFLTGDFDFPVNSAELPIGDGPEPPTLLIDQITGSLAKAADEGRQLLDLGITGQLGDLPVFNSSDPSCTNDATFSLAIVEGSAFEGTLTGVQPCGSLELGPLSMEVLNANLNFAFESNQQTAELDGTVSISLPADEGDTPSSVTGQLALDLMTGQIRDGSVAITQPFDLGMPWNDDEPPFSLAINEASLSADGLMLTGAGQLEHDQLQASVSFNQLLIGLDVFEIKSGSANIASGFSVLMPINPIALELVPSDAPMPAGNALRFNTTADLTLSPDGIGFAGAADALINYEGESYNNLRVELHDNFAMSLTGFQVTSGRAEFYWDQDGQTATEPLAIIDTSGFIFGGGLTALLPDRLYLPSEDIAYIDLKDNDGSPLISIDSDGSGYTLSTDDGFLPLVVPALPDNQGDDLVVNVGFSLTTDGAYNVTGGSIALESETTLESRLDLPVRLSTLELDTNNDLKLKLGLMFDLPEVFNEHDAEIMATLTSNGIESGSFTAGDYSSTYDPAAQPLYTFTADGTLEGGETDDFSASLMGIEAGFGPNTLNLAATLKSSLLLNDTDDPIFISAAWQQSGWTFNLDPGDALQDMEIGDAIIDLDDHQPLQLESTEDEIYLTINGVADFENVFEEPMLLSVQGLEVGVKQLQSSPSLHFELGSAAATLDDQNISLFDNAVELALQSPQIGLSGRNLTVSSDGHIAFLDQQLDFTGLMFSTDGDFQIDQAGLDDMDIQLAGEHLTIESASLMFDDGLRFEAGFGMKVPEPFDEYAEDSDLMIAIYRSQNGQIQVDGAGLEITPNPAETKVDLGDVAKARLTRLRADVDPFNAGSAGLYANAIVAVQTKNGLNDVIHFGDDNNFENKPGIGVSYSSAQGLNISYDVTGNAEFDIDISFFELALQADINSSDQQAFLVNLDGTADFNLEAVEASITYEGFQIGVDGVENWGNISGSNHSVSVADIVSLEIGSFIRESDVNGFDVTVTDTNGGDDPDPESLKSGADSDLATETINDVTELVCFGPCPVELPGENNQYSGPAVQVSIGGEGESEGGFSGGIETLFFYRTLSGDVSFIVEGLDIQVSSYFSMNAYLEYVNVNSEILIRAAASGTMGFEGGLEASAAIAGKFSNIGGQVSYGLFVGVSAQPGIPIVPGIVDITGAGGGFFYRAEPEDFQLVQTALSGFGYDLVNPDVATPDGDVEFAAMLYAAVGIGGDMVVSGQTFLQITNQSFYMDARGIVAQLDGGANAVAGTQLEAAMYASAQWDENGISSIIFGGEVDVEVPVVLTGNGEIEFFYVRQGSGESATYSWGIIGAANFDIYAGILSGESDILLGPPGFLIELSIGINTDIPIITVKSDITGSAWIINDENYSMPFGAYAVFSAEGCISVFCASVEAQGAFVVHQSSGYELFAAAKACVKLGCLKAWASFSDSGVKGGTGSGAHKDVVEQARSQKDDLQEQITSLVEEVEAAANQIQLPTISELFPDEETYEQAGIRLYSLSESQRLDWVNAMQNVESLGSPAVPTPSTVQALLNNVAAAPGPEYTPGMNVANNQSILENIFSAFSSLMEPFKDNIPSDIGTAIELFADSEEQFDQISSDFYSSPVSNVVRPEAVEGQAQSASFEHDPGLASQQQQSAENLQAEMELLDERFRESIQAVQDNVNAMDDLLRADLGILGDSSLLSYISFYKFVLQSFEQYYAAHSNSRWIDNAWALDLKNQVSTYESNIESGIQAFPMYYSGIWNMPFGMGDALLNTLALRTAQRVHIARLLADDQTDALPLPSPWQSSYSDVSDIYNRLRVPVSTSRSAAANQITNVMEQYFINMHKEGLDEYATNATQNLFLQIFEQYGSDLAATTGGHKDLTRVVDKFFTIKANMTSILWNLNDNYVTWRSEAEQEGMSFDGAPPLQTYINRRNQISSQLMPPQITSVTVNPHRADGTYFNKTDISWQATHPDEIVENAVDYRFTLGDNNDITRGLDDYLSIGVYEQITLYPWKLFTNTRKISFGVRVRGSAGNTAIRRATFNVDVGPGGNTTPPGSDVLPEVTDPPEAPVVLLEDDYSYTTENGDPTYWTNSSQGLQLTINGYDPLAGIATFEYAVGTSPDATDVLDWNAFQGERELRSEIPAEQMKGGSTFFELNEGNEYYVSARVISNTGMTSPVGTADGPVVLDNGNPDAPLTSIGTPDPAQPPISYPTHHDVAQTVPPLEITADDVMSWIEKYGDPELFFNNISASDAKSGISHFEYILSRSEDAPLNRFAAGDAGIHESGELHITGDASDPVFDSFEREVYLHVRAVDHAGNLSDITTAGPFTAYDSTVPEAGAMRAMLDQNDIKLYLTKVPYDPESDITGIQHRIVTWDGGQRYPITNFPSGTEVDLEWDLQKSAQAYFGNTPQPRYISIPRDGLTVGQNMYIEFRSVNTNGSFSKVGQSGPVNLDETRPVFPDISVSGNLLTQKLTINIDNVHDPESGIVRVEYDVRKPPVWASSSLLVDSELIYYKQSPTTSSMNLETVTTALNSVDSLEDLRVTVRIYNHAGLTRTRHYYVQEDDVYMPNIIIPVTLGF